jgi:ATP-binding cassette, subfamily B, bacterial
MAVLTQKQKKTSFPQVQQYSGLLEKYLLPQWPRVLLMALLLLLGIALQLASPQVIRYFLDTAQAGGGLPVGALRPLMNAALIYILFQLLQQGLSLAANYTSQLVSWKSTNRLRKDLALHCLRLDMDFHKQHTPGELIERIDGDVNTLGNFLSSMAVEMLGNLLLVLGILVMLFREDVRVGLGIAFFTGIVLLALGRIQRIAVPYWTAYRQAMAEQNGFIEERISGIEDIRANGAEEYMLQRLFMLMRGLLVNGRRAFVVGNLTFNITNLLNVIGYAIGLGMGVYLYARGEATLGTAYLIFNYVGMLESPLQRIREQAQDLQQATASIQRIQSLFDLKPTVVAGRAQSGLPAGGLPAGSLRVEYDDVTFHYEENDNVLEGVSFNLEPGKVLGILGRTGSGKSTMTRLLFHLYDPSGGAVRLGGTDLRDVPLSELRARVGLVTQDVQLFQASVRDNLTFFDPAVPDERLQAILSDLRLWDWVQSLPEGLNTRLGSGGQGLSAGEAQLLAFARVFLKDPGLVVLDEASSRLDPATETRMERAIDRLFAGRTGIIIAHRLKTVGRADDILILEEGRVVEYGPRAALAADPHSHFAHLLQTGLEEALA